MDGVESDGIEVIEQREDEFLALKSIVTGLRAELDLRESRRVVTASGSLLMTKARSLALIHDLAASVSTSRFHPVHIIRSSVTG